MPASAGIRSASPVRGVAAAQYEHQPRVTGWHGQLREAGLSSLNTLLGNGKRAMDWIYHAFATRHTGRYGLADLVPCLAYFAVRRCTNAS